MDPLASPNPPTSPPPWQHIWSLLHSHKHIPRTHLSLAWRCLHGVVFCGAFLRYINHTQPLASVYCPRPCCDRQPETISHIFLVCPVGNTVLHWVSEFWFALFGDRPPVTAPVFLVGDPRPWRPPQHLTTLWLSVRLATLYFVNAAACQRHKGVISNPASIVAKVIYYLRAAMCQDWLRTQENVTFHAAVPSDWFKGRSPVLTQSKFEARWGPDGRLYDILPMSDKQGLLCKISCASPVPVPRRGER